MGAKLLVRSYNVGCGDCIYVRIPNGEDFFHILIDCGSKEGANTGVMRGAIKHLEQNMLPEVGDGSGKKRLDMIVVSHRHEDHIKGFNANFFKNMAIGHIWLPASMDKSHTQAQRSMALSSVATQAIQQLTASGAAFSPELQDLVGMYGVGNVSATTTLTKTLPKANGIQPQYVYAGLTSDDFRIEIKDTKLIVLGPEKDIDGYYLGKEVDESLRGMQDAASSFRKTSLPVDESRPTNISLADFRTLQSRLLSNGLAFAVDDSSIQNNAGAVLLIEWRKRRLLFVGDAEWEDEYKEGKKNGSWNVMWHKRREHLAKPLDFLKVGHHGSRNATPWNRHESPKHEVNLILDAILPRPKGRRKPKAQCIVSTKRKQYVTIPDAELLTELGRRVSNTRKYLTDFTKADPNFDPEQGIFNYSVGKKYSGEPSPREVGDKGWLDKPQPFRTDLESAGKGEQQILRDVVEFVDVEIAP
ncbi:MAG: metallohydrolase [Candidatus Thiodiazotropha sp. (ex Lucinoma kastoroae)]|nr:metallohydrolase [Candidatus Thiodiazotropha sp. (ex Lucinoma kastoroae)]MCU7860547.1 metallohydrolase [Candidatus Thiodiazotropha sp. (ex Lucinoma kastoroae)]